MHTYDLDGDGIVDDEEMTMERNILEMEELRSHMENDDKKQDAQRHHGMVCPLWNVTISICSCTCRVGRTC